MATFMRVSGMKSVNLDNICTILDVGQRFVLIMVNKQEVYVKHGTKEEVILLGYLDGKTLTV